MTKKTYVDVFVFLLFHIYRRHLSPPVRKMCPLPMFRLWEKILSLFFQINLLSAHIRKKKLHITESYIIKFLVKICSRGKNLQDLTGQNPRRNF